MAEAIADGEPVDWTSEDSSTEEGLREELKVVAAIRGFFGGPEGEELSKAGTRLGAYQLVRPLGRGGFGEVWEAEALSNGRRVALKVLHEARAASPRALERFRREVQLAASLSHPQCVYVFGAEEADTGPSIAMELMAGGTLEDRVREHGPLPVARAVDHVLDVLAGLEAAHRAGIIHRDVKPSNCFLDAGGGCKIGDFGIARAIEDETRLTLTGAVVGTPTYASPEQLRAGATDLRSDLYSVGATLYALIAGKPPFTGTSYADVVARVLTAQPPPLSAPGERVPSGLAAIVRRLLAKDPRRRYPSHAAVRAALLPFSSRALTRASLGRRFAAVLIDMALLATLMAALPEGRGSAPVEDLLAALLVAAYYAVTEARWSASLGKRLFGLRVVAADGSLPALGQVVLRSVLFVGLLELPGAVVSESEEWNSVRDVLVDGAALLLLGCLPLLGTMRPRNGYAGLHELLSRTRVMAIEPPPLVAGENAAVAAGQPESVGARARRFGPYRETHRVWEGEGEELLIAHDDALGRPVWVRSFAPGADGRPFAELSTSGPGRLRWLQGGREIGASWDAYECPWGSSLAGWLRARSNRSWARLRPVLASLCAALEERPPESSPLCLAQVWIDAHGHARLLDFPWVPDGRSDPGLLETDRDWRGFLRRALRLAGPRLDALLLPHRDRAVLERLLGAADPYPSLTAFREDLTGLLSGPPRVTARRRLAALGLTAALPLVVAVATVAVWLEDDPQLAGLGLRELLYIALGTAAFQAPLALGASLLMRGGPLLHLVGIAVLAVDGAPAGRLRCLARTAVGWSPLLALILTPLVWGPVPLWALVLCAALLLAGVLHAAVSPERGINDLAAGTVLVPR